MNITASLQIKNNIYQVVLNYKDINGKRKQKWVSTGLSEKGNNKRLANQKMQEILADFKETINCTTSKNNIFVVGRRRGWLEGKSASMAGGWKRESRKREGFRPFWFVVLFASQRVS